MTPRDSCRAALRRASVPQLYFFDLADECLRLLLLWRSIAASSFSAASFCICARESRSAGPSTQALLIQRSKERGWQLTQLDQNPGPLRAITE